MQGIFRKENTDKALKYGIYRHLPTYEKIIRNLVSFYYKNLIPYSFLIAASGLSFIARFAGKYPASTPTSTANTMDISTSHHGI